MFQFFRRRKQKAYTKQNIDVFDVTIDREVNYDELINEIRSAEQRYPTDPKKLKEWYPAINEDQNKALIGAVEKYIYYPGDTVNGSVILTLKDNIPAKALEVIFVGVVVVHYERDDELKEKVEVLFRQQVPLWSFGEGANPVLCLGTYRYDFKFELPNDMLGSVFYTNSDKEGGIVAYSVAGSLKLDTGAKVSSDEVFVPIQRLLYRNDPFVRPELWAHPPEKEEKESTGLLGKGGDVTAKVTLHPGIYATDGQDMHIDLHVVNRSKKHFKKVKVYLLQHIRFRYEGETKYESDKYMCELKIPVNIRAMDESTMRGIRLPIPIGIEPSLDKHGGSRWAESLAMRYELQVGLFTGHHMPDVLVCFDNVLIGSRPRNLPPGEPLEETFASLFAPGNFEYKTCDVRVCNRKSFCSAKQALVASGHDAMYELDKLEKKNARK